MALKGLASHVIECVAQGLGLVVLPTTLGVEVALEVLDHRENGLRGGYIRFQVCLMHAEDSGPKIGIQGLVFATF